MPRTRAQQYPRTRAPLEGAPIVGMDDTLDWNVARPGYARELTNVYVPPGRAGRRILGRPGLTATSGLATGTVQYIGQLVKLAGTRYTICICGGKLYTLNWGTGVWTETVNAATFSGASITLSTSARFNAYTFADQQVFWDGTNTAWMWDGTTNGGLTKLTGAGVPYGAVTGPYYAKAFFIKQTERDAFIWSEEGDATTGYEAGGHTNAWSPLGAGPFHAIASSNDALIVAQATRMVRITGPVSTDFQTAGTRSDISETVGTKSPMLVTDNGIVLLSSAGEPHFITGGINDMWRDCQVATSTMALESLDKAMLVEWPVIDAVLIGVPFQPNTVISAWLVFRISEGQPRYIGRWGIGLNDTGAVVLDDSLVPTFLVAGNGDGTVGIMAQPTGNVWDDYADEIPHQVQWQPLGADADTERKYDRMTVVLDGAATASSVTTSYQTTRGTSAAQTATLPSVGGGDLLDISFILDSSTLALDTPERRVVFGLNGDGRWIAPIVAHSEPGKTFGLKAVSVESYPTGTDYTNP
jgi:hypothetical protein